MPTIYIIRGLPGSGKSTLARRLVHDSKHFEADMFHMVGAEYRFDPAKVKSAHEWCQQCVACAMTESADIAVSNTFTRRWEYEPYIKMANENGFDVQVIECHGQWKTIHGVPYEVISAMRYRWEPHLPANPTDHRRDSGSGASPSWALIQQS